MIYTSPLRLTLSFYVWYFDFQMERGRKFINQDKISLWMKYRLFFLLPISMVMIHGTALSLPTAEGGQATEIHGYPGKQIEWIIPYGPGGGYDVYSRAIAKILPEYLPNKVSIVIRNMPGAGGRRGSALLYRSKPDGYTIGILNPIGLMTSDVVKTSPDFDVEKYTYIVTCVRGVPGIFVRADSDFKTIEDLQHAENVKFATSGRGSGTWLWAKLIEGLWGVRIHMVSGYLGTTEYITALLRKDVDAFTIGFTSPLIPYFRSGEIRPLLIFSRDSWDLVLEAPTLKGTPFGELEDFSNDRAIAGPPGLPDEIVHILESALLKTLNDPELKKWSERTRNPLYVRNSEETKVSIKETLKLVDKYRDLFKDW
jgi:tripartite-type tricarboxylate transporter receptor subunit TctC